MNSTNIGRKTFIGALILLLLWFTASGNIVFPLLIIGAMFAAQFVKDTPSVLYWILFLNYAKFVLPVSVMRSVNIGIILELFYALIIILGFIIRKNARPWRRPDYLMVLFVVMTIITAWVRGFGIYSLGSSEMFGGAQYIVVLIQIVFCLVIFRSNILQEISLPRAARMIFLGAMVNVAAALTIFYFPSTYNVVNTLFDVSFKEEVLGTALLGSEMNRFWPRLEMLKGGAFCLTAFAATAGTVNRRRVLWAAAFGLALLSGFRTALLLVLLTAGVIAILRKSNRMAFIVQTMLVSACVYLVLWFVTPFMPFTIQRSITLIPGLANRVPTHVRRDAKASTDWRIELYKYSIREMPKHLVVGRGLCWTMKEITDSYRDLSPYGQALWAYEIHAYHNAALEILSDYGVLGGLAMLLALLGNILIMKKNLALQRAITWGEYYRCAGIAAAFAMMTFFSAFAVNYLYILISTLVLGRAALEQSECPSPSKQPFPIH